MITPLSETAETVATNAQHKGAVVISVTHEGDVHVGASGLTVEQLRTALTVVYDYSFRFED